MLVLSCPGGSHQATVMLGHRLREVISKVQLETKEQWFLPSVSDIVLFG